MRRGILLAGGSGSRLHPLTIPVSKQLMPVYDKPMIYYPLSVLMLAEITEILVITTPADRLSFQELLGDGSSWGISLRYAEQPNPDGLAQAFHIAEDFLDGHPSALILGDNIFYGHGFANLLDQANAQKSGATVFGYYVTNPKDYGVVSFDKNGAATSIEEKPPVPKSNFAVTGLYFYDDRAVEFSHKIKPSHRGELEITDLNRLYLDEGELDVQLMGRGYAWLDTGTHNSLLDAAQYVRIIEQRQGLKISCPEEIAWRKGYIDDQALIALAEPLVKSGYGEYLLRIVEQGK